MTSEFVVRVIFLCQEICYNFEIKHFHYKPIVGSRRYIYEKKSKRDESMTLKWLDWAKEIQAISQAGLEYTKDVYDMERFGD